MNEKEPYNTTIGILTEPRALLLQHTRHVNNDLSVALRD